MAVGLIPLKTLNIADAISKLESLQSQADTYSGLGAPTIPGVPDFREEVRKLLKSEKEKLIDVAREELIALLVLLMTAGITKLIPLIPEINRVIEVLNNVIDGINTAFSVLIPIAMAVFVAIIALVIVMVVTKIITMIPSIVAAWGTGISFDVPKALAAAVATAAAEVRNILAPIGSQIISFLLMILKFYGFLLMVMGLINMLFSQQNTSASTAQDSLNRSADDWDNIKGKGKEKDIDDLLFVECTLPSGEVKNLSPEDCIAVGGTFPGMDMIGELNNLDGKIRDCENQETQSQECIDFKNKRDNICFELGPLCDFQLNDNRITSLIHPHIDVTIEKAIKRKGNRYGFYQENYKKKNT